ncbi:uncharacterized protein LOC135080775 isoform X1 [Ostrinia nubilalis]|uniref:uncharacterized protein LOC135080775 isoform X1 n=1 Tax=Ostrinia nubilalis TaxID=29057 RepID=UPI00308264B1
MSVLKEFMQSFRKSSFKEVFIILNVDIFPQVTNYINLIENIKFEDGSYHTYFGEVKKVINGFLTYYKFVIDDVIQEADKCTNVMNRNELLVLIDRTIDIHQSRHIFFGREYLPVHTAAEKQSYEEMEQLFQQYMEKLLELKNNIERLDKQEKVDDFIKDHFKMSIKGTHELFELTHTYLALLLADRINQIRVSVEEIHLRARNNLRKIQAECGEKLNALLQQLYDRNKSLLQVNRQHRKCSVAVAEASRSIDRIRSKIEEYSYDPPISRLEEEVAYWEDRVNEFHQIAGKLVMLKKEQADVIKQEEIYQSMKTTELPGSKRICWWTMGKNFAQRKEYLKDRILEAARPLMSYFSIRGTDRLFYTDNIGSYYVDEYNHQVYVFDYGMGIYHLNCEGDFREVSDKDVHYFDTRGRYVLDSEGQKVYQCAPCTSTYKLCSSDLLKKTTKDCGHSEKMNKKCRMTIKDPRSGEILPDVENVDIKSSLDSEVVRYLWDSFGHVLPFALHDVGRDRTKNPIQHLAHKLLYHKYNKTISELEKKKKEAQDYRAKIFQDRKDKAIAASKAWKAKQVPRSKPEESYDDSDQRAHDAQATTQIFLTSLQYMNYD